MSYSLLCLQQLNPMIFRKYDQNRNSVFVGSISCSRMMYVFIEMKEHISQCNRVAK